MQIMEIKAFCRNRPNRGGFRGVGQLYTDPRIQCFNYQKSPWPSTLSLFLLRWSLSLLPQINFSFSKFLQALGWSGWASAFSLWTGIWISLQPAAISAQVFSQTTGLWAWGVVITAAREGEGRVPGWLHRGQIIHSAQSSLFQKINQSYLRSPHAKCSLKDTSHVSDIKWSSCRFIKAVEISRAGHPSVLLPFSLHIFVCLNSCFSEKKEWEAISVSCNISCLVL